MTAGEMQLYLEQAGFQVAGVYPSFDLSLADEKCSERIIFLAIKPEAACRPLSF